MDLTDIKTIKALLHSNSLFAKKSFGQNFLINKSVLQTIVEAANINQNDCIIEVGPGLGVLTLELAKLAKKILSIELDVNFITILKNYLPENVELIHQDALRFSPPDSKYKVVANIPYNITSHLINHFLQNQNKPASITLLIQKEVAEKICTLDPDMSVLSLQIALFGKAKLIKKVSNNNFYPAPKVDSAIIHIEIYHLSDPNYIPQEKALQILNLAKKAFSQRRKKLSNTLPELKEQLTKLNLAAKRPEHLAISDWKNLAQNLD